MKPSLTALGQPLLIDTHVLDWGNSFNLLRRGGKRVTMMVMMFVGKVVQCLKEFPYNSYCGKPTEQEFYVPIQKFFVTIQTQTV
jgi:hypothetical protein